MSELNRLIEKLDAALRVFGPETSWSLTRREGQWIADLEGVGVGYPHQPLAPTPEDAIRAAFAALIADAQAVVKRREEQAKGARDRLDALRRAIEAP